MFDTFERQALCAPACGFNLDEELVAPVERCNGDVLEVCAADGSGYFETACPGACETLAADINAQCRFAVCDRNAGTTCDFVDTDGDLVADSAISSRCNFSESTLIEQGCPTNACASASACEPTPTPAFTAPAPDLGSCNLASTARITQSGIYTVNVPANVGDNFHGNITPGLCGNEGGDVFWVVPARPGATVSVQPLSSTAFDPVFSIISINSEVDCTGASVNAFGVCEGFRFLGDDIQQTKTFLPGDSDMMIIIDSLNAPTTAGNIVLEVIFSDDPLGPVLCTEPPSCTDNVLTVCDADGAGRTTQSCSGGCNATGDACNGAEDEPNDDGAPERNGPGFGDDFQPAFVDGPFAGDFTQTGAIDVLGDEDWTSLTNASDVTVNVRARVFTGGIGECLVGDPVVGVRNPNGTAEGNFDALGRCPDFTFNIRPDEIVHVGVLGDGEDSKFPYILVVDYDPEEAGGEGEGELEGNGGVVAGPTVADGPTIIDLEDSGLHRITVDLIADRVYRARVELPNSSSLAVVSATITNGQDVAIVCVPGTLVAKTFDCRVLPTTSDTFTINFATQNLAGATPLVNAQVRVTLEEATFTTAQASLAGTTSIPLTVSAGNVDSWAGPWVLVTPQDVASYGFSVNDFAFAFNRFDATTFGTLRNSPSLRMAGDGWIVQVVGGSGGAGVLEISAQDANVVAETEPNDLTTTADVLPSEPVRGFGLSNSSGDTDVWRVDVPSAGTVQLTMSGLEQNSFGSVTVRQGNTIVAQEVLQIADFFTAFIPAVEVSGPTTLFVFVDSITAFDDVGDDVGYTISVSFD